MKKYLLSDKRLFGLFLLLVPIRAFSAVAVTFVITNIIEFASNGNAGQLPKFLLLFLVYILADFLINIWNARLHFQLIEESTVRIKKDIYHKISYLTKTQFQERSTADYISIMETDVGVMKEACYTVLDMIADAVRMAAAVIVVFWYSWKIGLFVIVTVLLQAFIPWLYDKKLVRAGTEYSQSQAAHMNSLKEGLGSFLTAKIFHVERNLETVYCKALKDSEHKWSIREYLQEYVNDISYVFNKAAYLGVFLLGGYLMIQGKITLPVIIAITAIVPYISGPSLYLVNDLSKLKSSKESFHKIETILKQKEDTGGKTVLNEQKPDLTVQDLSFEYDTRTVFSHLNYTFEKGKKYLIVGQSGGGKSTLLNLLAGLRTDYSGQILLGDTEIRQLSRECLTKQICVIEQEPYLFNDSIYNNVAMYEDISKDKVTEALKQVGLEGVLNDLENGIDTSLKENAGRVSGGEKQRIAIARALVRSTPILLLDESTSHLDVATASGIEKLVFSLQDVTVILVSHNATETAGNLVDHIVRMANGTMKEIPADSI